MASSSKNINVPVIFAISIGSAVALTATVMFGLAWYQYESRVVLRTQVIESPTHDVDYERRASEQRKNLVGIEASVQEIVQENSHGHSHGDEHDAHHTPGQDPADAADEEHSGGG